MFRRIRYAGIWAGLASLAVLASPSHAQFGGIISGASRAATSSDNSTDSNGCPKGKSRSSGSRVAGSMLGSVAGSVAGSAGGVLSYVPVSAFTEVITASIACKLDPQEQQQAADATVEATRGADDVSEPEVGATSEWTSATREDVTGSSTVVAKDETNQDGLQCIMVSDVIIVKGEETRANKRMCRRPPAARYAIAA